MTILMSRRVRTSPLASRTQASGVTGHTIYNNMLLPEVYQGQVDEYRHLKTHVQVWDVAAERQVALRGPQARELLQRLTPRDITRLEPSRCLYVPLADHRGKLLNDPIAIEIGPEEYWLSVAPGEMRLWVSAIAGSEGFNADVYEPDVSPVAIQGPKAVVLATRLFGPEVAKLGYFRAGRFAHAGRDWLVVRSGWSGQSGFEVFVEDETLAPGLWDAAMEAGQDLDIRAGCPNEIERLEVGLLAHGIDTGPEDSVLETGLGRFVSENQLGTCIGGAALAKERAEGSKRMLRPVEIHGTPPAMSAPWPLLAAGEEVGALRAAAYSPDFATGIGVAMINQSHWEPGTRLVAKSPDGPLDLTVRDTFWR